MVKGKIDGYIEPSFINNELDYDLWFTYNDIEGCFLYQDSPSASLAKYYNQAINHDLNGAIYTDIESREVKRNNDSFIYCIKGIDNILKSLSTLRFASENPFVLATFAIHLDEYIYNIGCLGIDSEKCINDNQELNSKLLELKHETLTVQKKLVKN